MYCISILYIYIMEVKRLRRLAAVQHSGLCVCMYLRDPDLVRQLHLPGLKVQWREHIKPEDTRDRIERRHTVVEQRYVCLSRAMIFTKCKFIM